MFHLGYGVLLSLPRQIPNRDNVTLAMSCHVLWAARSQALHQIWRVSGCSSNIGVKSVQHRPCARAGENTIIGIAQRRPQAFPEGQGRFATELAPQR
jgi:hypothetical protein